VEKWRQVRVLEREWWLGEGLATVGHCGATIEGLSVATSRSSMVLS